MRSRSLIVVLALLLAAGATGAVFLYVNAVKEDAKTGGDLVSVIVSSQDLQAGTDLNPLIQEGVFREAFVPQEALVDGAVTDLSQLRGRTTTSAILANEQIPESRVSGGEALPGGTLGISPGHIAVTVRVGEPQGGAGTVQRNDNVTVFATFSGAVVFEGFRDLVRGTGSATEPQQQQPQLPPFTMTLVPQVRVLTVENPLPGEEGEVTITLDLLPEDAQNLIFAHQNGQLYLGLLPPDGEGVQLPASSIPIELLLGKGPKGE